MLTGRTGLIGVVVALVVIIGGVAWMRWGWDVFTRNHSNQPQSSVVASLEESQSPQVQQVRSARGVVIELFDWPKDGLVTSPLVIKGRVPGNWSAEGQFAIELIYEGDIGLPGGTAELEGDWATTSLVPFTATIALPDTVSVGQELGVLLRKANPSGLPVNDDSVALSIKVAR